MTIYFFREFDEHGYLSNLSEHPLEFKGRRWPTSEHCYQAQKHAGTPLEEQVRLAPGPIDAKMLASDPSTPPRAGWNDVRVDVMRDVVRAKFEQNEDARRSLLATGDEELMEKSDDGFWGSGPDMKGMNWLGKVLMETRAALRAKGG